MKEIIKNKNNKFFFFKYTNLSVSMYKASPIFNMTILIISFNKKQGMTHHYRQMKRYSEIIK